MSLLIYLCLLFINFIAWRSKEMGKNTVEIFSDLKIHLTKTHEIYEKNNTMILKKVVSKNCRYCLDVFFFFFFTQIACCSFLPQ